jgi:hypothetical protein
MHDGVLPPLRDVALLVHRTPAVTAKLIEALIAGGLFERTERGIEPHDWNDWQYTSPVSTERVRRHRERQRGVSRNAPETHSENQRDREQSSEEPKGSSGPAAPDDPVKSIFDEGVALLAKHATSEKQARKIIGQWRAKARDDGRVAALIREAVERDITEPIAWFAKTLAAAEDANGPWVGVEI